MDLRVFRSTQTGQLVVLPADLVTAVEAELLALSSVTTYGELRDRLPRLEHLEPVGAFDDEVFDVARGEWVEVDETTPYDAIERWIESDGGYSLPERWMLDSLPAQLVEALVSAGVADVEPGLMSPEVLRIREDAATAVMDIARAQGHDVVVDDGRVSW